MTSRIIDNRAALSSAFWSRFVKDSWEKRPQVLKRPLATPLATSGQVFQGLVKASRRTAATDPSGIRFYIEQARQQRGIGKYLPRRGDTSLVDYATRLHATLAGRSFALVVNDYQVHDADTWLQIKGFLSGLYEAIGIPGTFAEAVLFFGNYEKTPFGIHQDPISNFMFVVEGSKRFLTWPDEVFRDRPEQLNSLDYEDFRATAVTVEGEAGDVLYWPSSYWHIAESTGGLALALSIAIPTDKSFAEMDAARYLFRMREKHRLPWGRADAFLPDGRQESADRLPGLVKRTIGALQDMLRDPDLEQDLKVEWLNRISGSGFNEIPPPLPSRSLTIGDVVQGNARFPIVWLPAENNDIICSANGHSFATSAHPHILTLLERLNGGEPWPVKQLLHEHAGTVRVANTTFDVAPQHIRALLEKLVSFRALTARPGSITKHRGISRTQGD